MTTAVQKIAELNHVNVSVKVSEISGKNGVFLGQVELGHYDPEKFIPNGGPVTLKGVSVQALGNTYDDAYNNVLEKAVELMGL